MKDIIALVITFEQYCSTVKMFQKDYLCFIENYQLKLSSLGICDGIYYKLAFLSQQKLVLNCFTSALRADKFAGSLTAIVGTNRRAQGPEVRNGRIVYIE